MVLGGLGGCGVGGGAGAEADRDGRDGTPARDGAVYVSKRFSDCSDLGLVSTDCVQPDRPGAGYTSIVPARRGPGGARTHRRRPMVTAGGSPQASRAPRPDARESCWTWRR